MQDKALQNLPTKRRHKHSFGILETTIYFTWPAEDPRAEQIVISHLTWSEPIYMRVGYVFESRFLAGMI